MSNTLLTLSAECDRRLVAAEVSSARLVQWCITAPIPPQPAQRAPLNLALVLDRSGSMGGDKLRFVQQAACYLMDQLDERDRVAVIAYDDEVALIAPAQPVSTPARQDLKSRINALKSGGCTNLSGGWLEGCGQIAAHQIAQGVNRALLLTDGLANRGITDLEELGNHARELRQRGVTTSTFGVGLDFNEVLLEQMAAQGGGHFHYIERPQQIADVFRRELGELLTVVAREASLRVSIPAGLALELLGDLPHERSNDRLQVFLGDLCGGEQRSLYMRVLTPPDALGTSVVLPGDVSYAGLDNQTCTASAEIAFTYVREAQALQAPLKKEVAQGAAEVEMATAAAQALRLERVGQRDQAQHLMNITVAACAPMVDGLAAEPYRQLAEDLGEGLSESRRKATHFAAYQARQAKGKK